MTDSEVAEPEEEALASPTTFFSFTDEHSAEDPDSEISPMSKVSGRFSGDSKVSNCIQKTHKLV